MDALGDCHAVAGASKGAVADDLPRLWPEGVERLVEHHGYVPIFSCQVATSLFSLVAIEKGDDFVVEAFVCLVPLLGVPNLEVVFGANDGDLRHEAQSLAAARLVGVEAAQGDTARRVDVERHGVGRKVGAQADVLAVARVEFLSIALEQGVHPRREVFGGESVHASVKGEELDRRTKDLAIGGGKGDAAFGIAAHGVGAGESADHLSPPFVWRPGARLAIPQKSDFSTIVLF